MAVAAPAQKSAHPRAETSAPAAATPPAAPPPPSKQTLPRKVNAMVMGVILPIGKKRKAQRRHTSRIYFPRSLEEYNLLEEGNTYTGAEDPFLPRSVLKSFLSALRTIFFLTPIPFPRKVSFFFTEDDALKRVVRRLLKECPKLCSQEDKEDFLVKLMRTMQEVAEEKDNHPPPVAAAAATAEA